MNGNILVGWVLALGLMASASLSLLPWLSTSNGRAQPPEPILFERCRHHWLNDPARGELLAAQQQYYAALSSAAEPMASCHG
ncbi:MAG: hypothetical protein WEA82_06965 [Idiomarina sp.]